MEQLNNIWFNLLSLFDNWMFWLQENVPRVLAFVCILLLGIALSYLALRFICMLSGMFLGKNSNAVLRLQNLFSALHLKYKPGIVLGRTVQFLMLLLTFYIAAYVVDFVDLSVWTESLFGFLQKGVFAFVVFVFGFYIISKVRNYMLVLNANMGKAPSRVVANVIFMGLIITLFVITLTIVGLPTHFVAYAAFTMLGIIFLSGSIAYGLAAKEILGNLLAAYYCRRQYVVGQWVIVDEVKGKIIDIDKTHVYLENNDQKIVYPASYFSSTKVILVNQN